MSAAEKWENQPDLFSYPKSRWDNPETSRQAAESIPLSRVTQTQRRVIEVYRWNGWEMCDEKLVELYFHYWPNTCTDQSVRSRRGELVRAGKVFDTGKRLTTKYGRSCVVWRLAS
jgi:hypothetical protein